MLDLDHPQTEFVFQASGLIEGVMLLGQQMTVSPSAVRQQLLAECELHFAGLRRLHLTHFGDSASTAQAIDEYEAGIRKLAGLGDGRIEEDRRDGEGDCPYCRTKILKFDPMCGISGPPHRFVIVCQQCSELFMDAKHTLSLGFGTAFI